MYVYMAYDSFLCVHTHVSISVIVTEEPGKGSWTKELLLVQELLESAGLCPAHFVGHVAATEC